MANEWIKKDPFANIKFHLDEVDRDFLEDQELKNIMDKDFGIDRLNIIRDMFVFCCFTELAFSYIKTLNKEHLAIDNEGITWIRKPRIKTKKYV